jgi:hypothetical protein
MACPKSNNKATYDFDPNLLIGRFKHIAKGVLGRDDERRQNDSTDGPKVGENTSSTEYKYEVQYSSTALCHFATLVIVGLARAPFKSKTLYGVL